MVRDGFGDDSGAKLIEQRGIDFAPSEDFIQTLKAAGASEAFLNALRAAQPPEPASARKPLNQAQLFALLAWARYRRHRVATLVEGAWYCPRTIHNSFLSRAELHGVDYLHGSPLGLGCRGRILIVVSSARWRADAPSDGSGPCISAWVAQPLTSMLYCGHSSTAPPSKRAGMRGSWKRGRTPVRANQGLTSRRYKHNGES